MAIFRFTSVSAVILVTCLACRIDGAEALTVDGKVLEGAFSGAGGDVVFVTRNPNMPDDMAQAINMLCFAQWVRTGQYPDFVSPVISSLRPPPSHKM